jgi:hypothetical protein
VLLLCGKGNGDSRGDAVTLARCDGAHLPPQFPNPLIHVTMATPFLEARNLGKGLGSVDAWAKAPPSVLSSRVHALLGENGAGDVDADDNVKD